MFKIGNSKYIKLPQFLFLIIISIISLILIPGCGGGDGGSHSYTSSNSAILTWNPPNANTDSSTLSEISGYKVYYGISSGNYSVVIDVGNVTEYKIDDLSPETYYFAVTAYNIWGYESNYSNEVSKTIY